MSETVKGYKVFNEDWTCRNFQYEVGKTFEEDVGPEFCERGFHFCTVASDCFNYYNFNPQNKVAEVEALGKVDRRGDDSKCATNILKIVREITWEELLTIVNSGIANSGLCNSGDWNSGDWNSGDCNSGDWNSGNRNSGNCNSGNRNSGNCNSGDCNSGNRNSGNCNSGDWNKTNFSSGCFNTEENNIRFFNKESDITYKDWTNSNAKYLLNNIPREVVEWIWDNEMTDEEKKNHPKYETTQGYLKVYTPEQSAQMWYDGLNENEKETIKRIPNFNADIFEEITGIRVE